MPLKTRHILIACLAFTPFLLLAFYIHPVADDFTYTLKGENHFFKNLIHDYLHWNGRYVSNVFVFLNPARNLFIYQLYPVVLIILLLATTYFFFQKILKTFKKQTVLFLSIAFNLVYLNLMTDQSEGLYWFTGSVTYVLPLSLVFLYLTLILRKSNWSILVLFILCGFNEVMTITLLLIHTVVFLIFRKTEYKNQLLLLFFIALAGMMIMKGAPGNLYREGFFTDRHQFFHSFYYSILQTIRFSATWILSPSLIIATLIYWMMIKELNLRIPKIHPIISVSLLFVVVFCCVFPAYWSTGILGQHRTLNTACFFFLLIWFYNIHIFSERFDHTIIFSFRKTILILLIISFFITGNSLTSWMDIFSGKAASFHYQLTARENKLKDCFQASMPNCQVSELSVHPESIFVLDIRQDSTHWINGCYAVFYGLNSVSMTN